MFLHALIYGRNPYEIFPFVQKVSYSKVVTWYFSKKYSTNQIKGFEKVHLSSCAKNFDKNRKKLLTSIKKTTDTDAVDKYVENKLPRTNTEHRLRIPRYTGIITKSSVRWLYHAIYCCVLRDISKQISYNSTIHNEEMFSHAIYTFFNLFETDHRYKNNLVDQLEIIQSLQNYGYSAAAKVHAIKIPICRGCKQKEGNHVGMERVESNGLLAWECPKCKSNKSIYLKRAILENILKKGVP